MPYIATLKEAFALTPLQDREKVVDKLASINTEDWFYYRGLILLQKLHDYIAQSNEPEKIREPTAAEVVLMEEFTGLLGNFRSKFGEQNRKHKLLHSRYHVLIFTLDPSKSMEFIKKELYLDLDLTKKSTGAEDVDGSNNNQGDTSGPSRKNYPTVLSPDLIDAKKLIKEAIEKSEPNHTSLGLEKIAYPVLGAMLAEESLVLTKEQEIVFLESIMQSPFESYTEINLIERLVNVWKSENTSSNSNFELKHVPFDNFTLDQLDELMNAIPQGVFDCQNFINSYLKKLVPEEYSKYLGGVVTFWEDSNGVLGNYLDKLEPFVNKLPDIYQSLKSAVQFHKLRRDIAREELNEERFVSYLNKSTKAVYEFSPKPARSLFHSSSNQEKPNITIQLPLLGSSNIPNDVEWNMTKEYLTGLVVQGKLTLSLEDLGKYIDYHNVLKPLYAEIMLTHSQDQDAINKAIEVLGVEKYEKIVKKTSLSFPPTILHKTSKRKPEDNIDIILRSKNIPRVSVRVYQIDVFNYWKLQLKAHGSIPHQPFKSKDMNLDGLCPTWEDDIDIEVQSALLEKDIKLSFGEGGIAPEIFSGRGLWVIEFIGGGEQCRVVVQKGYLRHIMQNTTGGHIVQVIDEVGQPFSSSDVKIWHSNQYYKADKNGNILISFLPSNETSSNCTMLLISEKDGFSEPFSFQRLSEEYNFKADFYVNPEMVSYNKTSKVIINPRLQLCGLPIALSLLENIKLNINCTNVRDVKSGTTITNLTINKSTPLVAEFVVPGQLTSLEFELEATIKNLSGTEERLSANYSLSYDFDSTQTAETASLHLKVTPDMKYLVYALGKNGEPKSEYEVEFEFKNIYLDSNISKTLQTNDEGIIELGELPDIQYIWYKSFNNSGKWNVISPLDETRALLPSSFCIQADKDFKIICPTQFPESNYSIYATGVGRSVLKRLDGKIKKEDGYVVIFGLPEGTYNINVPSRFKSTPTYLCTVIQKENNDGSSEESKNFWSNWLIGKNQYSKETGNILYRPLSIKEIQMTESNLTFSLKNWSSKTVAIVTTSTFVPSSDESLSARLQNSRSSPESYVFDYLVDQTRTIFLDGCKLGEEYQYILNRAKAEKWIGSTLTKPTLLMYPMKITGTNSAQRNIKDSIAVGASAASVPDCLAFYDIKKNPRFLRSAININTRSSLAFLKHTSHLNYFYPDLESGIISIDRNSLGEGNILEIVIVSGEQVISKEFVFPDMNSLDFKRNDIRQSIAPELKETVLIRSKAVSCLQPSETLELKNTNGEWKAIDSFEKLYEYSQRISGNFVTQFSFLNQWPSLSISEKLKLHEEKVCYEFNLWLKKKDTEFFDAFVAPAIKSKLQRSFMDLYLIDSDLSEFEQNIYLFNKLSTPEKALLATKQGGELLSKVLRLFDDSFEKKLDSQSEIYFDSILTSCDVPVQDSVHIVADTRIECIKAVIERGERLDDLVNKSELLSKQSMGYSLMASSAPPPPSEAFGGSSLRKLAKRSSDTRSFSPSSPQYSPTSPSEDVMEYESADGYNDDDDDLVLENKELELREQAIKRRKQIHYKFTESTSEWSEVGYFNGASPAIISPNQFWIDFLRHYQTSPDQHFLSENFIYSLSYMSEVLFVLSLIDLPFSSKANWKNEATDSGLKISTETPLMVFYRSLKEPSETSLSSSGVILSQELFVYDPSVDVASEDCVKVNSNLLETNVEYGRQLIISNITSKELICEVTIQIPSGSVPTRQATYFQSKSISISPYSTWNDISGTFYFPSSGEFVLPSISLATSTGSLITKSEVRELTISNDGNQMINTTESTDGSDAMTKISNWPAIASKGSNANVISFLEAYKKLDRVDMNLICWRMTDPTFARDIFTVLGKSRSYYNETLWKYGVYHRFADIVRQLLQFKKLNYDGYYLGHTFDSVLVSVEPSPFDYNQYVLDYYPLLNARSHPLNPTSHEILNNQFYKKYDVFLSYLEQKTTSFSIPDFVMLTLYLIIQERIGEAHDMFSRIPKDQNECTVQVDYIEAYLSTRIRIDQCSLDSQLNLQATKERVLPYKQFGVLKWRKLFASLLDYINEVEQGRGITCDNDDTFTSDRLQARSVHTEPTLDFEIDSDNAKINIHYSNLEYIDIRCYEMNIEVMFSENPFLNNTRAVSRKQENYNWIKPSYSQHVELSKEETQETTDNEDDYDMIGTGAVSSVRSISIDLPKELISSEGKNVFVELTSPDAPALKRRQAYFANRLAVHTVESFGIVRILSETTKRPVPGVYVKVYARKKNSKEVHFWKDGYTGLNGVFDYISTTEGNALMGGSNTDLKRMMEDTIDKLSLLILSNEDGAVVKEVYPPMV